MIYLQSDFAISRGFYFTKLRIKPSRKYSNLQYAICIKSHVLACTHHECIWLIEIKSQNEWFGIFTKTCPDPEGGGENHNNIGFHSNTDPDPLNIAKLSNQRSILGHHRHASETPFKWRFAGGLMMAHLW